MKTIAFICSAFYLAMILSACVVQLTLAGRSVRPVSEERRKTCEILGIVTGSGSMGNSTAHDMEGALNEVRNETAKLGGNRFRIISLSSSIISSTVVGEALKCP